MWQAAPHVGGPLEWVKFMIISNLIAMIRRRLQKQSCKT